jgi:DNA-binding MarR family transcriptional regulator
VLPPDRHPGDGALLELLDAGGPRSQQDLGERLRVNRTIMVKLVDRLEQAGLLERHRNPQDRREYALRLTPSGRRRLRQAREVMEAVQAEVTEQLGQSDHRQLNALLRQLLTAPPVTATRSRTGQDPDLPASQKQR